MPIRWKAVSPDQRTFRPLPDGLSFTGMRERYLEVFDHIWIDCLNGDKYKTGKRTPEGKSDPSIFSTEFNDEGIQVGTAITLMVRNQKSNGTNVVGFRHFWGTDKRDHLLADSLVDSRPNYEVVQPALPIGLPFVASTVDRSYFDWPLLPQMFPHSFPGVKTSRDDVVIDIDREHLAARMQAYFDPDVSDEEMARLAPASMESTARFDAKKTRIALRRRGLLADNIIQYCYRPFDLRWIYWEPTTKLLDEKRSEFFPQIEVGSYLIEARQRQPMAGFDRGYVTRRLSDNFGNGLSNFFPLMIKDPNPINAGEQPKPNISPEADNYLTDTGADHEAMFFHVIATLHAPAYRNENQGALKQDWPRVPLPATAKLLLASAAIGRELSALLVPDGAAPSPAARLKRIGPISCSKGTLDPNAGDLELTAGWGHAGKGGVTMPAKGKVTVRELTAVERDALPAGAIGLLGEQTCDVWLNDRAYWCNIPLRVWEYTLGGYQVIKKWLSYREKTLLGRSLTVEEARYVTDVARRIAAILLLTPVLNANYLAVKSDSFPWRPAPSAEVT